MAEDREVVDNYEAIKQLDAALVCVSFLIKKRNNLKELTYSILAHSAQLKLTLIIRNALFDLRAVAVNHNKQDLIKKINNFNEI